MNAAHKFAAVPIGLAMAGLTAIAADFDTASGLFFLGLVALNLAGMAAVAWYFAGKRSNLDDAYEMGYEAGFQKGRRVRPKVIRLEHDRERTSPRTPTRG